MVLGAGLVVGAHPAVTAVSGIGAAGSNSGRTKQVCRFDQVGVAGVVSGGIVSPSDITPFPFYLRTLVQQRPPP